MSRSKVFRLFPESCLEINRKINIFNVDGVTISQNSKCHELVIHVRGEYDYRYVSPNYHELVAITIRRIVKLKGLTCNLYKVVSQFKLMFQKPQTKLKEYTTGKKDVPQGIFRRPDPKYIVPDPEDPKPEEEKKEEPPKEEPKPPAVEEVKAEPEPVVEEIKVEPEPVVEAKVEEPPQPIIEEKPVKPEPPKVEEVKEPPKIVEAPKPEPPKP
jgi:hypothetical protein